MHSHSADTHSPAQVSNMTGGAVHAPTTPQHSTQSMLSTQQNAPQQGSELLPPDNAASPRLSGAVDAQTAAELAAAATRVPINNLGSLAHAAALREAYTAGLSSRSGSPMVYDQTVPAIDDHASAQEGITFRPIAVRSKTEAAPSPGGWRFGDGSGAVSAWGGSGGGVPFQPAAFAATHSPVARQSRAAAGPRGTRTQREWRRSHRPSSRRHGGKPAEPAHPVPGRQRAAGSRAVAARRSHGALRRQQRSGGRRA